MGPTHGKQQRRDIQTTLAELAWPNDIPIEALTASMFDRAMRAGMFEAEVILGYIFDRTALPGAASREARLMAAIEALCRFASNRGRLDELRYEGRLVSDETLLSDGWTAASPRLPCMRGLYEMGTRAQGKVGHGDGPDVNARK